eukprot:2910915-Ditylum_brightwellii.AAC.1
MSNDAKLGSTAVVGLNGTLGDLGFLIKGIPAKVKSADMEVTKEVTRLSTVGKVKPMKATIWRRPAWGVALSPKKAARPLG